jgi:hypothetical protein
MTDSCHDASCDSSHSCRCIVYSAVDPLESGSMDRIDSNHEIVRVGHIHNNLSCNGNIMRDRETSVDNENSIANGICCCSKRPRSTTRSLINAIVSCQISILFLFLCVLNKAAFTEVVSSVVVY